MGKVQRRQTWAKSKVENAEALADIVLHQGDTNARRETWCVSDSWTRHIEHVGGCVVRNACDPFPHISTFVGTETMSSYVFHRQGGIGLLIACRSIMFDLTYAKSRRA